MNEALQALEVKIENGGATPQGKFFAKDWNTLVEAVKQLDLAEFDEAALNKYLKDNGYITSDDIPSTDLSNLVTLSTEQTIPGPKNFTGGIKVNGQPLFYNAELGVWELTGDLLVTGNVAWFASIKGFKPSTIMDAVQVDGETIVKNELGQLKVIGGGSGGSGGGLTISGLSNYLTTNKYTKQSDVETLISTALTPYALTAAIPTNNNQLTNGAGYITASALDGYATQSWVGDNYLASSNFTKANIKSTLGISDWALAATKPSYTAAEVGALSTSGGTISGNLSISTNGWGNQLVLNSIDSNAGIKFQYSSSTSATLYCAQNNPYWQIGNAVYNILHSGNIGSHNAGSADKLAKTWSDDPNYHSGAGLQLISNRTGVQGNYADSWVSGLSVMTDYVGWQLMTSGGGWENPWFRSFQDTGSWKPWRKLAFLTDNVASATKLQTARTIWGQSFDGSGNVDGDLYMGGATILHTDGSDTWLNYGGANDGKSLRFCGKEVIFQYGRGDAFTRAMTITNGGNVAVGDTTADELFHVHGKAKASLFKSVNGYTFDSSTTNYCGLIPQRIISSGGDATDFWLYNTTKIHYYASEHEIINDVTINGNLLVNGNFSWITQSQRSLKNIIDEQGLSLAQLERIKPIKFYWKDGRDAALHVGGVADVFAEVLPEVVSRWKDTLCLNYVDAGFYVGASLIAPVVDHERRIAQLEKENAELKQKLNQLAA